MNIKIGALALLCALGASLPAMAGKKDIQGIALDAPPAEIAAALKTKDCRLEQQSTRLSLMFDNIKVPDNATDNIAQRFVCWYPDGKPMFIVEVAPPLAGGKSDKVRFLFRTSDSIQALEQKVRSDFGLDAPRPSNTGPTYRKWETPTMEVTASVEQDGSGSLTLEYPGRDTRTSKLLQQWQHEMATRNAKPAPKF